MRVVVLGVKKVDFVDNQNRAVKGLRLYFSWDEPTDTALQGMLCDSCFLPEAKAPKKDIAVGAEVDIFYNRFGKVDSVIVS